MSRALCGPDCPVETVTWWSSLAYANALSASEGRSECYSLIDCVGNPGEDMSCGGLTITSPSGSVHDCAGYRLPTEAEWEYAARAGTDLLYSGSDVADDVAWFVDNSGNMTHPVATKQPNDWGLYDMSGNVMEWTQDWHRATCYPLGPVTDPEGPTSGPDRVARGGRWGFYARGTRVANRDCGDPAARFNYLGLRLVRTAP